MVLNTFFTKRNYNKLPEWNQYKQYDGITLKISQTVKDGLPIKPFLANSTANRLVIFSSSLSEYFVGSIFTPALAPPNGTSTTAHL